MINYNLRNINKELDKLKMPKEYRKRIVNIEKFLTHDITMQLSIREDAGKTTQGLILGIVFYKLYGITTEYLRCDKNQTTKGNIETLYDVVRKNDYINKLYDGYYDDIEYKSNEKKFYLVKKSKNENDETIIEYKSECPLCHVCNNEEYIRLKSSYNNPLGDFILFDEFLDTQRSTRMQMIEFMNNVSTIGRKRPSCHVLMLGNNVNQYSFWWEEFTIENEITSLNYGGCIDKITDLGTTLYCEMLQISDKQKEVIKEKKIRFSGFNTPKMASFNGLQAWQGSSHPHIPYEELLNNTPIYNRIWIKHRNRYIRINIYKDCDFGYYLFLHFSNKPKKEDGIVCTTTPEHYNETYGFGEHCLNKNAKEKLKMFKEIMFDNRIYFSTNSVGDLFSDYKKEIRDA